MDPGAGSAAAGVCTCGFSHGAAPSSRPAAAAVAGGGRRAAGAGVGSRRGGGQPASCRPPPPPADRAPPGVSGTPARRLAQSCPHHPSWHWQNPRLQSPWPLHWLGQNCSCGVSHVGPPVPSSRQGQASSGSAAVHQPRGPKRRLGSLVPNVPGMPAGSLLGWHWSVRGRPTRRGGVPARGAGVAGRRRCLRLKAGAASWAERGEPLGP